MSTLSTHVLDTAIGLPAKDIPVLLELKIGEDKWRSIGRFATDGDGRVKNFLSEKEVLGPGTYRLTFDTRAYMVAKRMTPFFPVATIVFEVGSKNEHYHVPLLFSGFGYSTYRGS